MPWHTRFHTRGVCPAASSATGGEIGHGTGKQSRTFSCVFFLVCFLRRFGLFAGVSLPPCPLVCDESLAADRRIGAPTDSGFEQSFISLFGKLPGACVYFDR